MQLMHQSEFDIFKIASRMVADTFNKSVPVGMSGGFVTDQMSCLMEKHFTNMCI